MDDLEEDYKIEKMKRLKNSLICHYYYHHLQFVHLLKFKFILKYLNINM
jgi:hypothetical protein